MFHRRIYQTFTVTAAAALVAFLVALPAQAEVTQDFHRTVSLPSNGRVSLENVNGDVEITGWNRNEVQIDAVKKADDRQKLDAITIDVNAGSDSVDVQTKYPKHMFNNNNPGSVHYTLHIPQSARLDKVNLVNGALKLTKLSGEMKANLVNGTLTATQLGGAADLATVNGTLDADYTSFQNVREIKLQTVNGRCNLSLPRSANADISANSVSGDISTDFPLTVKGQFVGKSLSGQLGSGGAKIQLNTVNGSIHIGPGRGTL